MISITNTKVAGFTPRWTAFRGFSILWDNPGQGLARSGQRLDLACDIHADAELHFYKTLHDSLTALDVNLLTNTYLFCPLPPPSYHVTLWDGGNDGNIARVLPPQSSPLQDFLTGLPDSILTPNPITDVPAASSLVTKRDWNVRFHFESVQKWSNFVLAAYLTPADEASANLVTEISEERKRLNAQYKEVYGISSSDNYVPHVSLGYFANKEHAQLSTPCLPDWNRTFAERMQGQTLSFQSSDVYGFTDMATFFKATS
jgi:hypothetical protein